MRQIFLLLIAIFTLVACTKDDNVVTNSTNQLEPSNIKIKFWGQEQFRYDLYLPQEDGSILEETFVPPYNGHLIDNPLTIERDFFATGDTLKVELSNSGNHAYMTIEYEIPYIQSSNSGVSSTPATYSVSITQTKGVFKLSTNSIYSEYEVE